MMHRLRWGPAASSPPLANSQLCELNPQLFRPGAHLAPTDEQCCSGHLHLFTRGCNSGTPKFYPELRLTLSFLHLLLSWCSSRLHSSPELCRPPLQSCQVSITRPQVLCLFRSPHCPPMRSLSTLPTPFFHRDCQLTEQTLLCSVGSPLGTLRESCSSAVGQAGLGSRDGGVREGVR